jgi:hypothetical protein
MKGYAHIDGEIDEAPRKEIEIRWTETGQIEALIDGKWIPALAKEVEMTVQVTKNWGNGATVTRPPETIKMYDGPASAQDIAQQQMKKGRHTETEQGGGLAGFPAYTKMTDMPQVVKDRTKARFDLLPWGPIWKMAEVMTNGANKPGRVAHNWRKGTEWSDYYGAMMRHGALWQQGEDFEIDPDTGTRIDHLAAVMCCAAILLEYQMFSIGTDNRFPAGRPAYKGDRK